MKGWRQGSCFDFLQRRSCVSGVILCIIYTEPTIVSADQSVVKIRANTIHIKTLQRHTHTSQILQLTWKSPHKVGWGTWLHKHNLIWSTRVKTDLKLSEKKGMSVGGRGPTLFLFALLCQCSITNVDIIVLLLPMLLSLLFIFGKCSQLKEEEIIILVTWNWKATFLLSINSMTQTDGKVKKLDRWGIAAHCQGFLTCVIISSGYRIQETGNRKPNISLSPMTS